MFQNYIGKVVPIRPVEYSISQQELRDIRLSREMVARLSTILEKKERRIAERLRCGARIEPGDEEFDQATVRVRKKRFG